MEGGAPNHPLPPLNERPNNMEAYKHLVEGFRHFRDRYLSGEYEDYRKSAPKGQKPPVLIIGCCDSRVNPAILTEANLGEIFVVNNVANIVPPYKEGPDTHHSTSAAIEYAVTVLKVRHVIVLGHSGCGGIRLLMTGERPAREGYSFLSKWMEIASDARSTINALMDGAPLAKKLTACEKEAILVSLSNLKGFPFVKSAMDAGELFIHGWHFDIEIGEILAWEANQGPYTPLSKIK